MSKPTKREELTQIGLRSSPDGADAVLVINDSDVRPTARIDVFASTVAGWLFQSYQQGHAAGQAARSAVLAEVLLQRVAGPRRVTKRITRDADDLVQEIVEESE